jgi:hypothetical protein
LLDKVEQGTVAFIHELIDRLDGKPAQVIDRRDALIENCATPSNCTKPWSADRISRRPVMRLSSVAIMALIVGASSPAYVSIALAAPECSRSMELADWGENSTGDISIASGDSCTFPITLRGATSSSEISQKPAHGKLKKLNVATYEYQTKAKYKGSDTFVIKATGKGPKASGTSVITVHATIK